MCIRDSLSPLYDVNPVPEGDELSLCVNEDDATISLDLALEIAPVSYTHLDVYKRQAFSASPLIVNRLRQAPSAEYGS